MAPFLKGALKNRGTDHSYQTHISTLNLSKVEDWGGEGSSNVGISISAA